MSVLLIALIPADGMEFGGCFVDLEVTNLIKDRFAQGTETIACGKKRYKTSSERAINRLIGNRAKLS